MAWTTAGEALAAAEAALSSVLSLPLDVRPEAKLDLLARARQMEGRLATLVALWAADVDRSGAARTLGMTATDFLTRATHADPQEAGGILRDGRDLRRSPELRDAAIEGRVTPRQVSGIKKTLRKLPPEFTAQQKKVAEQRLIEAASTMTPTQLSQQADALTQELAPEIADDRERELRALAAQRHRALQSRFLHFLAPVDGSVAFEGSLPVLEVEQLKRLVTAFRKSDESARRNNPASERDLRSRGQQDADALMALVTGAGAGVPLPGLNGGSPRLVVTMTLDDLMSRGAGLLPSGEKVDADTMRQICCTASIIPVVLGAEGVPLAMGRETRLVTADQRLALSIRDKHCAFPGCEVPDEECEAHHVVPWPDGGPTDLDSLVLLCRHHHGVVEPRGPDGTPGRYQWVVTIENGKPTFREPSGSPPPSAEMPNRARLPFDAR